jgi:hypothetical protein
LSAVGLLMRMLLLTLPLLLKLTLPLLLLWLLILLLPPIHTRRT